MNLAITTDEHTFVGKGQVVKRSGSQKTCLIMMIHGTWKVQIIHFADKYGSRFRTLF
jgi:hypothetical protein